jgi:hypothetical protein
MFRRLALSVMLLAMIALPGAAQSDTSSNSSAQTTAGASGTTDAPVAGARTPKKVWTNEDLGRTGPISVVGDKRNQNYNLMSNKLADPATISRLRTNLQKLQAQLQDVNKQLRAFKEFQEGEPVSTTGRQVNRGYNRIPVDQQMAALQARKKNLEEQIDTLTDEARKKGIEPGALR